MTCTCLGILKGSNQMPRAVSRWDEMIFSIFVMLAQVGLEAYILGTLFHYVVKKDAKLEEFRSAISQCCCSLVMLCHCHFCIVMAVPSNASAVCMYAVCPNTIVQLLILQSICSGGHQHTSCIILCPALSLVFLQTFTLTTHSCLVLPSRTIHVGLTSRLKPELEGVLPSACRAF